MQALGLALMSKALPFTLQQAKRTRLRKHAQKTKEKVKEIRGKYVPAPSGREPQDWLKLSVSDLK